MRELVVFGVVGIIATLTHYIAAIFAIEILGMDPLAANFIAYCTAVGVSFFGHSMLTFRTTMSRDRFIKFVTVSLSALAVSQGLLLLLTYIGFFGHRINMLAVVAVVPVYSYVLNKFWVYKKIGKETLE
jgi:putative flippase GtrA